MNQAYIGLGTNIEPREQFLNKALLELCTYENINIKKESSIYQTPPVGYEDQADFLNMVIKIETTLSSLELLNICQKIEQQLGRERTIRFGPRTIDLDILVYNHENIKTERLTLPHPRMHERGFVLVPLKEIAEELIIPKWEKRVEQLIKELNDQDIHNVKKWTTND